MARWEEIQSYINYYRVNGKMVNNMVWAIIQVQMVMRNKENGLKENELDGQIDYVYYY